MSILAFAAAVAAQTLLIVTPSDEGRLSRPSQPAVTSPGLARANPSVSAPCTPVYPPALAAWPVARPVGGSFIIGRSVELTPVPVANVRLAVQPSKPLSGSHLATASFEVKSAGTYTVAAGGVAAPIKPLWLDVAGADGRPLTSVAHGHGAACTSITKAIDFTLTPGRYTLLATGLTSAAPVRVLIVRKP